MQRATDSYNTRDYWIVENRGYAEPNFRLRKCARLVNHLARGRQCTLLDLGCGPAALRGLLDASVGYCGIDMAIQEPAPFLRETDFAANPISFDNRCFDFVVAMGVFEYMGNRQSQKFDEIHEALTKDGHFVVSYINFGHLGCKMWPAYNNVQSIVGFLESLRQVFRIERFFPVSHHWRHKQPGKNALPAIQMRLNCNVPLVSAWLAVEYFFVCRRRS